MSLSKKNLIINKKKSDNSKMIILKDTIKILKNLTYGHDIEISGILERNQLNVVDIVGLFINGKKNHTKSPSGDITFHTHPYSYNKIRKFSPPSTIDFLSPVCDYYSNKNVENSLVLAPEGIYTYNLTNKFIKELDNIKDRKISINKFSQLYSELYEKYTTMYFMYQFKKKESIKDYKKWFQDGKIDKEYYKFMIKFAQNGITEVKYGEIMKDLGCDLKLYKWDDKRMDIKLLKGTEVTNKILSFQDKKEVDKFRKDCSKQQLKD